MIAFHFESSWDHSTYRDCGAHAKPRRYAGAVLRAPADRFFYAGDSCNAFPACAVMPNRTSVAASHAMTLARKNFVKARVPRDPSSFRGRRTTGSVLGPKPL